jgi:Zn-dependent M16 (insulinase) family peptidase
LESAVLQNGHGLAMSLASRNFSLTRTLNETWGGIHQLKTIKEIGDKLDDNVLNALSEDLKTIGKTVFKSDNLRIALVGEDAAIAKASSLTEDMIRKLDNGMSEGFSEPDIPVTMQMISEGWTTSSAVSFVASAFTTVRMAHEDAPALSVISKMLRSLYIHREVREKGGAYGGMSSYNSEDGIFCFASYRDPHIVSTLNAFSNACDFIKSGSYTEEDVKEAILQVCSDLDKPDAPGEAAKKSFYRKLISISDEDRNRFKQGILKLSRQQIMTVAEKYFDKSAPKSVAVISGEEKLTASNEKMGNPLNLYRI